MAKHLHIELNMNGHGKTLMAHDKTLILTAKH